MAYLVLALSAWLLFSASTALRPGRKGIFAAFAYPVGWAAGELPAQAIVLEAALLALLKWWGWPRTHGLSVVIAAFAVLVVLENVVLVLIAFYSRRTVRRAMSTSPRRPLEIPRPREDLFGAWWRTVLQIPFHPRHMQIIRNVAYGPEPRNRLDIWRLSTTPANAPVVFYIHGGAWTFGDKREQGRPMLHEFVERGWIAVVCNYRLAPRHPWPAQMLDVTRTLLWIKKNIANHGGDPDRIVVSGGSAGGHLASLLALSANDPTWRPTDIEGLADWSVRGCMSFYGVLEMTGDDVHWHGLGKGLLILLEGRVVQLRFDENQDLYRAMSPMEKIDVDSPPFLVIQGGNDTLVDVNVARDFVMKFRDTALAPIYYVELPFTQHAFDVTASPRTSATTRAAVAFATSVSQPRPSLTNLLVSGYQSPPTELLVEVSTDEWVSALEAVPDLGPFSVVTGDNPFSLPLDDEANQLRRDELLGIIKHHDVSVRRTIARDPSGGWPDEQGFALLGQSGEFARALARAFEQFAYYDVLEDAVLVRGCDDGEAVV
jgi:acetyl esterase/lipase